MSVLQLRRYLPRAAIIAGYQPLDADLTAVAASGVASAWTAYTPTITAGSGTFTTVSATGRYMTMGKVTFVEMQITITTNGSAAVSVNATLPNTSANAIYYLIGREQNSTGKTAIGRIAASGTAVLIVNYDNTYPGGSGFLLPMSGCYENA